MVDFGAFASSVRQLCDKCLEEASSPQPKFSLVLTPTAGGGSAGDAVLAFRELNYFRELCHLSLQVCRGSDAQVKDYLVECIKGLQLESRAEGGKIERLESELANARETIDRQNKEVNLKFISETTYGRYVYPVQNYDILDGPPKALC